MFGFEREILLMYSGTRDVQARIIQQADGLLKKLPVRGRVETLLYFLLSPSQKVFDIASTFAADAQQNRIAVPFFAGEAKPNEASSMVVSRLREHLFKRDLFDIEELKRPGFSGGFSLRSVPAL